MVALLPERWWQMPKISVIVPVYNVEKYLARCLDSLINQTFQDFEIICVNDGSTDSSLQILEEYKKKDERIVVISQENKKLGAARNTGVSASKGEYITYVDSDDWVDLDYLEKLYNASVKYNADVSMSSVIKDRANGSKYYFLNNKKEKFIQNVSNIVNEMIILGKWYVVWGKLYRRSVIENLSFIEHAFYEDIRYLLQVSVNVKSVVKVSGTAYHYFANNASIIRSGPSPKKTKDRTEATLWAYNFAKEHNIKLPDQCLDNEKHLFYKIKHCVDKDKYYVLGIKVFEKKVEPQVNFLPKGDVLNIVFSVDDNYVQHLGCTIVSILQNKQDGQINFYVISSGLSPKNVKIISKLAKTAFSDIKFINVNNDEFKDCPLTRNCPHISIATYYRFVLADLLPELDKVLYLDCDLVTMGSLKQLYNKNVDDYYFAGVKDFWDKSSKERLNIERYCNAGVILVNLKKFREEGVKEKLFNYAAQNAEKMIFQDQDVLNCVLQDKMLLLDKKWNIQVGREGQKDDFDDVKIYHFVGANKPWTLMYILPFKKYYLKYLRYTPWGAKTLLYNIFSVFGFFKIIRRNVFRFRWSKKEKMIRILGCVVYRGK